MHIERVSLFMVLEEPDHNIPVQFENVASLLQPLSVEFLVHKIYCFFHYSLKLQPISQFFKTEMHD